jgi:GLPGLI family protein
MHTSSKKILITIGNQSNIISGYVCKKATVNYAGRDSAWYNPDIPQLVPINFMDYLDW